MHLLRQLENLDESLESRSGYTGTSRWMITYADVLTILLCFFIILFAVIQTENQKLAKAVLKAEHALAASGATNNHKGSPLQSTLTSSKERENYVGGEESHAFQSESVKDLEESLIRQLDLNGQQVTVSQDSRGLVISLQERIFFDQGKANLSPQAENTLNRLGNILKETPHSIRVEGHTDNSPITTAMFPSNWELSTARATTIVRNLVEKHHFPPERLSAAGYGEFYPLSDNSTIEGKQKNRRVDIVLLNPSPEAI